VLFTKITEICRALGNGYGLHTCGTAVPRLTQPFILCGKLHQYQPHGRVIIQIAMAERLAYGSLQADSSDVKFAALPKSSWTPVLTDFQWRIQENSRILLCAVDDSTKNIVLVLLLPVSISLLLSLLLLLLSYAVVLYNSRVSRAVNQSASL